MYVPSNLEVINLSRLSMRLSGNHFLLNTKPSINKSDQVHTQQTYPVTDTIDRNPASQLNQNQILVKKIK